jgi:hypothetical protein
VKKIAFKLYDKLIIGLLFFVLCLASCEEPDIPTPDYGVVPMYGVPVSTYVSDKPSSIDNFTAK